MTPDGKVNGIWVGWRQERIFQAMPPNRPIRLGELSSRDGTTPQSVLVALRALIAAGLVEQIGHGLYQRKVMSHD